MQMNSEQTINTNENSNKSEQLKARNPSNEIDFFSDVIDIKDDFLEPQQSSNEADNSNSTFISKVFYSSYNNKNGNPHRECYHSQLFQQNKDGHEISEGKENYQNSNGVMKSAYQRKLDERGERIIREKNAKDGKMKQHKIYKGMKEEESQEFNDKYEDYAKKSGFGNELKRLRQRLINNKNELGVNKQLNDGNHYLNRKILRN